MPAIPLIQRIQRSLPTAATTDVLLPRDTPGQIWEVTHLVLSDDAAGDMTVIFGVTDLVGFRPLDDKQAITTGDAAWALVNFFLGEQDTLTARCQVFSGSGQVTFSAGGQIHVKQGDPILPAGAGDAR
jgi:hypothetical protein